MVLFSCAQNIVIKSTKSRNVDIATVQNHGEKEDDFLSFPEFEFIVAEPEAFIVTPPYVMELSVADSSWTLESTSRFGDISGVFILVSYITYLYVFTINATVYYELKNFLHLRLFGLDNFCLL